LRHDLSLLKVFDERRSQSSVRPAP
jgi:hypothetical protein